MLRTIPPSASKRNWLFLVGDDIIAAGMMAEHAAAPVRGVARGGVARGEREASVGGEWLVRQVSAWRQGAWASLATEKVQRRQRGQEEERGEGEEGGQWGCVESSG